MTCASKPTDRCAVVHRRYTNLVMPWQAELSGSEYSAESLARTIYLADYSSNSDGKMSRTDQPLCRANKSTLRTSKVILLNDCVELIWNQRRKSSLRETDRSNMNVDRFPYTATHPDNEGTSCLMRCLKAYRHPTVRDFWEARSPRSIRNNRFHYCVPASSVCHGIVSTYPIILPNGPFCYSIATLLYQQKLPFTELDICDVLTMSQHLCGHGADVIEPFEMMLSYARKNGITPRFFVLHEPT